MLALQETFSYERWANRRIFDHLRSLESPPEKAVELFAHVLGAIEIWLTRIDGESSSGMKVWPTLTPEELPAMLERVEARLATALPRLHEVGLDREVRYTNQTGAGFVTSIRDILGHLSLHGAYHRGQIALVIRQSGLSPVNTDYITFVREGAGRHREP